MATPEELTELEKGLKKCFGDGCKVLQEQVDVLKSQLKTEEVKEIPQEHKDYISKCIGEECQKLREEEREFQKQWHIDLQEQAQENEPEEEPEEEEPQKDYCWECSKDKPSGQNVEVGTNGCTHGG